MNDKMVLPKWRDKTATEKILYALQILICILAIFLVNLQIFNILDMEINVLPPLIGINFILLFMQYIKYNKLLSFFSLAVAIFVFMTMLRK